MGYMAVMSDEGGLVFQKFNIRKPKILSLFNKEENGVEHEVDPTQPSFFDIGPGLSEIMQETIDLAAKYPEPKNPFQ